MSHRLSKQKAYKIQQGQVWGSPKHKYSLGGEWIKMSSGEKNMRVFAGEELNITQMSTYSSANCVLGYIKGSVVSRSWEMIFPPSCALIGHHVDTVSVSGVPTIGIDLM